MILTGGMATPLWTIEDRDAVKAAVLKLATGQRAVKVSFTGAGAAAREVDYQMSDLPALEALLMRINAAVGGGSPVRLASFDSGLNTGTGARNDQDPP